MYLVSLAIAFGVATFLAPPGWSQGRRAPSPATGDPDQYAENRVENEDGTVTWYYHCRARTAAEMLPILNHYIAGGGRINNYSDQNTLIIVAQPERMRFLERLLERLDRPRPQVLIQVVVISLTYDSDFQFGWEGTHDARSLDKSSNIFYQGFDMTFHPEDFLTALQSNPPVNSNASNVQEAYDAAQNEYQGTTLTFSTQGFDTGRLGALDFTLRTLSAAQRSTLLARPVILVEPGYSAKIETGQEVPVQSANFINNQNTVVSTSFISVGINLEITPLLIGPDSVRLDVVPEVSAVREFFDPGGQGLRNPIISRRNARTRVNLSSGETLQIGGLRFTRNLISETGIPLLMDIPLLGYLFRATRKQQRRQDIAFYITPTIISGTDSETIPPHLGFTALEGQE